VVIAANLNTIAAVGRRDVYGKPPPRRRPVEESVVSRRSLLRIPRTSAAAREIDFDSAHERVLRGWESGPHERLLRAIEPAAEVLVGLAGLTPGEQVLDAAAGDGNLSRSAARAGAEVYACDLSPSMVERGRARGEAEGRQVAWRVADVQDLPYPDEHFDAVLSSFGAAHAPRALRTASELVRVARRGARVGITAWVPRGLPGRLDELIDAVAPLPDGVPLPSTWGREEVVRRRLGPLLEALEVRTRTLRLTWDTPELAFEALAAPYALDSAERAALRPAFDRLLASCNDRPPGVELSARYLIALGRRPG
jgi:2-polyprenyl-3-methyl-5-hydroxy-6-metoxy-1,4-benzoquinol methylase